MCLTFARRYSSHFQGICLIAGVLIFGAFGCTSVSPPKNGTLADAASGGAGGSGDAGLGRDVSGSGGRATDDAADARGGEIATDGPSDKANVADVPSAGGVGGGDGGSSGSGGSDANAGGSSGGGGANAGGSSGGGGANAGGSNGGGGANAGGSGGAIDASSGKDSGSAGASGGNAGPDAARDLSPDVTTGDAPGTCGVDQDCPSENPLCLGHRCARCTSDSDCAGRSGTPACLTSSGLCVGCTANSHCIGPVTTCNTTTNQCVGCVKRSDCPGVCQTCTNSACTAAKSQDDTGLCAGTCDSTGVCKSKQGQTCQTVAAGCAAGTYCSDGYCCDRTCSGSCEACDITGSLGTCKAVATIAPHTGHPPCTTSADSVCDGKCDGASTACSYPTAATACGLASCSAAGYQAPGTCSTGACARPNVSPCTYACVASIGCTGICKPGQTQCSGVGNLQTCNANGAWQDNQPGCTNGNTCANGSCVCSSPNTQCPSGCVNVLGNDVKNCGSCGHDCLGGTCSAGQCQPAVVVTTSSQAVVFGVDNQYVYYHFYDAANSGSSAYRVSKTATGATSGTHLLTDSSLNYDGVIGTTLIMDQFDESYSCTFPPVGGLCATPVALPGSGTGFYLIPFKSPAPQYFAMYQATSAVFTPSAFNWYTTSNALAYTFGDIPAGASSWGYPSQYAFGNNLYWSRYLADSVGTNFDVSVWSASTTSLIPKRLTANTAPEVYTILDANAQSLLLTGNTAGALYRVALPNGDAAHPPALLNQSTSSHPTGATEDASRAYWFEGDGTLYACLPPSCASSKTALAGGQPATGFDLYQDTSASNPALYWGANPGQVMRLAK